jgi:hypothetical protein
LLTHRQLPLSFVQVEPGAQRSKFPHKHCTGPPPGGVAQRVARSPSQGTPHAPQLSKDGSVRASTCPSGASRLMQLVPQHRSPELHSGEHSLSTHAPSWQAPELQTMPQPPQF